MKLGDLFTDSAGRPFAFIDDEIEFELQHFNADLPHNSLLIATDPKVGMTVDNRDTLKRFARQVVSQ